MGEGEKGDPTVLDDTLTKRRRSRYERDHVAGSRVILDREDVRLLRAIGRWRWCRWDHVALVHAYPRATAQRRLRRLFDGGFVTRAFYGTSHARATGSPAVVYALSPEGRALLVEEDPETAAVLRLVRERPSPIFLTHTLLITEFAARIEAAAQWVSTLGLPIELIAFHRDGPAVATTQVALPTGETVAVRPDAAVVLTRDQGTAAARELAYRVEVDRGSEDRRRLAAKILGYGQLHAQAAGFQVLYVSEERAGADRILSVLAGLGDALGSARRVFFVLALEDVRVKGPGALVQEAVLRRWDGTPAELVPARSGVDSVD